MRRGFFILVIVLSFVQLTDAQQLQLGFHISKDQKKIKIPFELHNNLIVIPVILNKTLPLKFVLDTGVRTAILVDKHYSDFLNLKYSRKYIISGVGNEKLIEAYVTNSVSLTLPGVHGEGHALLVLERDLMELKNYLGTDVHGILGYELFSRFIIKINYNTKVLTIIDPDRFKGPKHYDALPMVIEDTKPHINATLTQDDGSEVDIKLMVDSGASQSLFIELETDSINLKLPDKNIYTYIGRGLGGSIKGYVGRMPMVKIGSYEMEEIIINYPENEFYLDSLKSLPTERNGTLGGEVLSRFNVIFDFPRGILYLKKNSSFKKPFTYNLSGLTVKAAGPFLKVFEVTEVRENSAGAEAGIIEGDRIIYIQGYHSKDLKLSHIIGFLNSKPNKRINMVVQRNDQVINVVLRLKSII